MGQSGQRIRCDGGLIVTMTINQALLQQAVDFAVAHETPWDRENSDNWGIHAADPAPWNRLLGPVYPRGPVSGSIRIGGELVMEWGEPHRSDLTFSVAKTYLAMLAGVAHDQGLIPDVNEPVRLKAPGIGFESAHNQSVTWLQLLQQTSEWEGTCFGVPDQVDRYRTLPYQPQRPAGHPDTGVKGDARPLQTPGTFWEYNDVRINQLSLALLHVFRQPLSDVFREHIARPSGVSEHWRWEGYDNSWVTIDGKLMQSVPGGTHWGGGISISSDDQARLAQMLLNGGKVGQRQILSEAWVRRMLTPCDIAPWYGTLVWLNRTQSVFPSASTSSYFCIGAGANLVWTDPERDMVAVVRWMEGNRMDGFCRKVTLALDKR